MKHRRAILALLLGLAWLLGGGLAQVAAQAPPPALLQFTERFPNGAVKRKYIGYKDRDKAVPHGRDVYYNHLGQMILGLTWRQGIKDGEYKAWYDDGKLREEGQYRLGKKDGRWVRYDEQGTLISEGFFANDLKEGLFTAFYPDGKKKQELTYRADLKDGRETRYAATGEVLGTVDWRADQKHGVEELRTAAGKPLATLSYQNGAKHGLEKQWYENEQLKLECGWQQGQKHGTERHWLAEGRLIYEAGWNQGKLHGVERRLNPSTGKPLTERTMAQGQLAGPEKEWYTNGQQRNQVTWAGGKRNGQETFWDENGRKLHELGWLDDQKHGLEREWYADGSPLQETTWDKGLRQGPRREWFPGGARKLEAVYDKDKLHGPYIAWNEAGVVRSEGEFREDQPWAGQFVEPGSLPNQHFIMRYQEGYAVDGILFEDGRPKNGKVVEYYIRGDSESTTPGVGEFKMREFDFVEGRRHGPETRWYPNGQVAMSLVWKQNKPDGELKEFFETGKEKRLSTFVMGVKDGREVHWNREGGVICDGIFRQGQPWEGNLVVEDRLKQRMYASKITVYHRRIAGPAPTISMDDDTTIETIKSYRAGKRLE